MDVSLIMEIEGLASILKDAQRYKWLRDEEAWGDDAHESGGGKWAILGEKSHSDFDEFIDAEMAKEPNYGN